MKQSGSDRAIARGAWLVIGAALGAGLVIYGIVRGLIWLAHHIQFK